MNSELKSRFVKTWTEAFEHIYTGSIAQWAGENVSLPPNYAVQGSFNVSLSPYLQRPFADLLDPKTQQINLVAATQTGKTLVSELFIPFVIINAPGPVLKLHQTDEMAAYFTSTRLLPLLENCKPVKVLLNNDRFSAKMTGVRLPHMSVKVAGAKENVLHGASVRYLELDECWLYSDPDTIAKAKARTTAFGNNKKILLTSQPGIEGDPLDKENTGLEYEWGWRCRECGNLQPWYWSKERPDGSWAGIVWQKCYSQEDSGSYDYQRTGDSAKLQCFHCSASYEDTETNRKYLNDTGEYIQIADHGNHSVHTYRWCGFVNSKISFKEKVIEYLQAVEIHKRTGLTDKLRLFRQQVLGQNWKRSGVVDVSKVLVQSFSPDVDWPEQVFRCLSIDYQRAHAMKFYAVVAFSKNEMRILEHGYKQHWGELNDIAEKYKVPPPAVCVDSGYCAAEVYLEAYNRGKILAMGKKIERIGWTCFKGADKDDGWTHSLPNGDKVVRYFSPLVRVGINNKQTARLFHWSNYAIKTILYHIREGKSDMKLVLPTPNPDFTDQLNAETLQEVEDPKTGLKKLRWVKVHNNNHYLDICAQAITLCMMSGKFGPDPEALMMKPVERKEK